MKSQLQPHLYSKIPFFFFFFFPKGHWDRMARKQKQRPEIKLFFVLDRLFFMIREMGRQQGLEIPPGSLGRRKGT